MNVYRAGIASLCALLALSESAVARACTFSRPPDQKLKSMYLGAGFSAVVAVSVVDASYKRGPIADAHPWSATAKIDSVLIGDHGQKTVTFDRGGGSSACEDDIANGNSLPKVGDKWIIYFWESPNRGPIVWESYPLDVAAEADPALGPSMQPSLNKRPLSLSEFKIEPLEVSPAIDPAAR